MGVFVVLVVVGGRAFSWYGHFLVGTCFIGWRFCWRAGTMVRELFSACFGRGCFWGVDCVARGIRCVVCHWFWLVRGRGWGARFLGAWSRLVFLGRLVRVGWLLVGVGCVVRAGRF